MTPKWSIPGVAWMAFGVALVGLVIGLKDNLPAVVLASLILGGIVALVVVLRMRQQAQEDLEREQFLVETLLENIPDHIYFKDQDSRFIRVNRAMAKMFKLSRPKDAIGKTDFDFFLPEHARQAFEDEQAIMATGKPLINREEKETWPDGSVTWVTTSKVALRDKLGQIRGTLGISRDITDRKNAEHALAQSASELTRSNRELEHFAYVASHDLQEPLRMIASYLQLLERRCKPKLDDEGREFLGFAVEGAKQLQNLIQDLLLYSRVGKQSDKFAWTDAGEVLQRALSNLKFSIDESGIKITQGPLPKVMGDARELTQLFQNLLSNAIKFRKQQAPEAHISAEMRKAPALQPVGAQEWVFAVRDNGIGIESGYFERIFVIFQRLHTREEVPGTGIGLALCKRIVERHGGKIWVESQPGQGSTFFFTIPHEGTPS